MLIFSLPFLRSILLQHRNYEGKIHFIIRLHGLTENYYEKLLDFAGKRRKILR
ncbi:hypothetical protein KIS1582_3854 [Cytobacillus firmus]|uniref:Uncharacterized protein n=1 Tax=Cytobacillus firmus TaxID=1399 RepID=A0A800MTZ2_CYTFI|nr:hypothetical protein KIS1582_3854 [Cytobacillus firmus]